MENTIERKYHKLSPQGKKISLVITLVLFLIVFPILGRNYYRFAINRSAQGFKETTFEINEGESVISIAKRLHEKDLVNSEFLFKVFLVSEGLHTSIQAGIYEIPAGASVKELSAIFQHGTNDIRMTFLEGWRVEEYARHLTSKLKRVDYDEFIRLAGSKEGFLFPDTYFFNTEVTESEVVSTFEDTFRVKTAKLLTKSTLQDLGMSVEEVIIFASIVEREVSREDDRPIVAGILIKRWKNDVLIGADATTQYAVALDKFCAGAVSGDASCPTKEQFDLIDWWPSDINSSDLKSTSPYNTRKNVGLPPSPIANPGLSSIAAVVNFTSTSYNYYLTDNNGVTHYANTLEEHNRNVTEYLN